MYVCSLQYLSPELLVLCPLSLIFLLLELEVVAVSLL